MRGKIKTAIRKYSRILFYLLSWILLLGIIIQVSLAGLAVFVDGGFWQEHRALVNIIEFIPALMFVFGNAGGIPKFYKAWSFLLFFFINFQYYTTFGWLGAIHAVFTLVIFMTSLLIAWGSYQTFMKDKKETKDSSQLQLF